MNPERLNDRADIPGELNILSIFLSVDGEANYYHPGTWTTFVRFTGCRVGCHWCDTKYSWSTKQGKLYKPRALMLNIDAVARGCRKITITGGEPLEQAGDAFNEFLGLLYADWFDVTMETAGTEPVKYLFQHHPGLKLVLDYKLPSARTLKQPLDECYTDLTNKHVVKFVISDLDDFFHARDVVARLRMDLNCNARMVFSPTFSNMTPGALFDVMKKHLCPELRIGLNLQMHKYIFPEDARDEEEGGMTFEKGANNG
jgi:7-carboxy-7-deazaguanine synthase